jgi:hypothetical protein
VNDLKQDAVSRLFINILMKRGASRAYTALISSLLCRELCQARELCIAAFDCSRKQQYPRRFEGQV